MASTLSPTLANAPWRRAAMRTAASIPEGVRTETSEPVAESHENEEPKEVFTTTVKNTFIAFHATCEQPRRKSVPPSARLCLEGHVDMLDGKESSINWNSEGSTYAQTEASTCSECGVRTPMSEDGCCLDDFSPACCGWTQEEYAQNSWFMIPSHMMQTAAPVELPMQTPRRLNSRAAAYQPQAPTTAEPTLNSKAAAFKPQAITAVEPSKKQPQQYKRNFADMLAWAKDGIQSSEQVANVEVISEADSCSIVIQPHAGGDCDWQTEQLITVAKEALLDAAASSKSMYVMGYCGPKPFVMRPQGFEATVAVMASPTSACWHYFKKGFCQHGDECNKQHPPSQMPVRVLVETTQFDPCPQVANSFKQEVADVAMAVMATLSENAYADEVEATKDSDRQGWTIEVTPKEELKSYKEYLLTLAKNALFSVTSNSSNTYIMGYAAKPFTDKSNGFVAVLGDMPDESKACWDLYSNGSCCRDLECRWNHPKCLTPINVVVKDRSSIKGLNAALECLACDAHQVVA